MCVVFHVSHKTHFHRNPRRREPLMGQKEVLSSLQQEIWATEENNVESPQDRKHGLSRQKRRWCRGRAREVQERRVRVTFAVDASRAASLCESRVTASSPQICPRVLSASSVNQALGLLEAQRGNPPQTASYLRPGLEMHHRRIIQYGAVKLPSRGNRYLRAQHSICGGDLAAFVLFRL